MLGFLLGVVVMTGVAVVSHRSHEPARRTR